MVGIQYGVYLPSTCCPHTCLFCAETYNYCHTYTAAAHHIPTPLNSRWLL